MSEELIVPGSVSPEALKAIFDAAYVSNEIDKDGDLVLAEEGPKVFISIASNKKWVRIWSGWRTKDIPTATKLEYANRVNDDLLALRAAVTERGGVVFDFYLLLDGGLTPRGLVGAYRNFLGLLKAALSKDDDDTVFN